MKRTKLLFTSRYLGIFAYVYVDTKEMERLTSAPIAFTLYELYYGDYDNMREKRKQKKWLFSNYQIKRLENIIKYTGDYWESIEIAQD